MKILENCKEAMRQGYICDNCLGRIGAQALSGYSNKDRGRMFRAALAMALEAGEEFQYDPGNFHGFKFRLKSVKTEKPKKCYLCEGFFDDIDLFAGKIRKSLGKIEFDSFLVGTRLSKEMRKSEEALWDKIGIEYCEPIRAEINREVGKRLEKLLRRKADLKNPEIAVILNLEDSSVKIKTNPLFVFGYYKKLARGIPQSKWDKYKTSIEQIVAKPLMKLTGGRGHGFHGAGREDINARCLAWRPFVIEILEPKKRKVDLRKVEREVKKSKKIIVKLSGIVNKEIVRKIKKARPDKTYRAIVKLDKDVSEKDLKFLKKIKGIIHQRTPQRVAHRRSDLTRNREVKSIKYGRAGKKLLELEIKGTAGLYIKELISGDEGRTKPSVSGLLNRKAVCKELDVIKIGKIKI